MSVLTAAVGLKNRGFSRTQDLICAQAIATFEGCVMVWSTQAEGVIPGDGSGGGSGAEFAGFACETLTAAEITAGTTRIKVAVEGVFLCGCSTATAQTYQGQAYYYDASAASDNPADLTSSATTGDTMVGTAEEWVSATNLWLDISNRATPTVGP